MKNGLLKILGLPLQIFLASITFAYGQNPPVIQSGQVTVGHTVTWAANGVVQDGGSAAVSLTGAFAANAPVCFSSATVPVFKQCANPTLLTNATFSAGTALIAPVNYTAGVNLTTPIAGAQEYDGTVFYQTPVNSNRGVTANYHFERLTAAYSLANVNTAQAALNGTTNGAITLPALTGYRFHLKYLITNTGTVSHTWAVLFGGTATLTSGTMSCVAVTSSSAAVAAAQTGYTATLASAYVVTAASTSATENATITCDGTVNINATGTFIPQVQLSTATGNAASMLAGSFFEMWAQGSNTVVSVGNWN